MRTVVAAFHDRENADAAALDVVSAGHETALLELLDERWDGERVIATLTELDVPRDRAELHAEAIRRGAVVLVAQAAHGEAEHVASAFDRHQSLDLDRAGARWHEEGWAGYDPGAAMLDEEARKREREQLQRESLDDQSAHHRAYLSERHVAPPTERDRSTGGCPARAVPGARKSPEGAAEPDRTIDEGPDGVAVGHTGVRP